MAGGNELRGSSSGGVMANRLNEISSSVKFGPLHRRLLRSASFNRVQTPFLGQESTLPKGCADSNKDLRLHETDNPCGSIDMDDMALSLESGYEMYGNLQHQLIYHCDDGEIGGLLKEKNFSVTESNSSHTQSALEVVV